MAKTARAVNISIFLIWAGLLSLLVYRSHAGGTLEKTASLKGLIDKTTYWYDIYAGSKKIGFANTTFEKVGDETIIKHEREVKVLKSGEEKILQESVKSIGDSRRSIKFLEYTSHFKDEPGIKVTGEVDDLVARAIAGDHVRERRAEIAHG